MLKKRPSLLIESVTADTCGARTVSASRIVKMEPQRREGAKNERMRDREMESGAFNRERGPNPSEPGVPTYVGRPCARPAGGPGSRRTSGLTLPVPITGHDN